MSRLTFLTLFAPTYISADMPTRQLGIPALSRPVMTSRISDVQWPFPLASFSADTPTSGSFSRTDDTVGDYRVGMFNPTATFLRTDVVTMDRTISEKKADLQKRALYKVLEGSLGPEGKHHFG